MNEKKARSIRAHREWTAIEVKSGRLPAAHPGMVSFSDAFNPKRKLLVGGDGVAVEEVLWWPVTY